MTPTRGCGTGARPGALRGRSGRRSSGGRRSGRGRRSRGSSSRRGGMRGPLRGGPGTPTAPGPRTRQDCHLQRRAAGFTAVSGVVRPRWKRVPYSGVDRRLAAPGPHAPGTRRPVPQPPVGASARSVDRPAHSTRAPPTKSDTAAEQRQPSLPVTGGRPPRGWRGWPAAAVRGAPGGFTGRRSAGRRPSAEAPLEALATEGAKHPELGVDCWSRSQAPMCAPDKPPEEVLIRVVFLPDEPITHAVASVTLGGP